MKTICLDFDGVCNLYTDWKGEDELFEPRPGLQEFIDKLLAYGYRQVLIHSTRPAGRINDWLARHGITGAVAVDRKPRATCYLDDRAVTFCGDFNAALFAAVNFKAYWEL